MVRDAALADGILSIQLENVIRSLDAWFAQLPEIESRVVLAGFRVLNTSFMLGKNYSSFHELNHSDRVKQVETWESTDSDTEREAISLFRGLIGIHTFDTPEVRIAMGYQGGCGD